MKSTFQRTTGRLRYVRRLGGALVRSTLIVLKSFAPWAWVALAILWFCTVLIALSLLTGDDLGWSGRSAGAAFLIVASVIALMTVRRWIVMIPEFFGSCVFAGLVNYSRSGVSFGQAAMLLASLIASGFFAGDLARHSLTNQDRTALTAALMSFFIALMAGEWMPLWACIMVALFAIPWLRQRLHSKRTVSTNSPVHDVK